MTVDGLVIIDKPAGPTSHDIIDRVRRLAGQKRVGHTGTLDPGASGVLVVCFGRATRLIRFLQEGTKVYTGIFVLGVTTDTLDAQGKETGRSSCAAGRDEVEGVMATLVGEITQTPPMMSALKVDGKKLYKLARRGEVVERAPRRVSVKRFDMADFKRGDFPQVSFEVECGKGTYVRSLVAEVGERLGCGGHLAELRRTVNGPYSIHEAHLLDEIESLQAEPDLAAEAPEDMREAFETVAVPIDDINLGLPELHLSPLAVEKVGFGTPLSSDEHPELADVGCEGYFQIRDAGRLIAVYRVRCGEREVTAAAECVLAPSEKRTAS